MTIPVRVGFKVAVGARGLVVVRVRFRANVRARVRVRMRAVIRVMVRVRVRVGVRFRCICTGRIRVLHKHALGRTGNCRLSQNLSRAIYSHHYSIL